MPELFTMTTLAGSGSLRTPPPDALRWARWSDHQHSQHLDCRVGSWMNRFHQCL